MSAIPRTIRMPSDPAGLAQNMQEKARQLVIDQRARESAEPKSTPNVRLPQQNQEIENIKRQLSNLIDRVERLKSLSGG